MSGPVRVQRKRAKGWTMPQNTVYVGRPTQWGNPFSVMPRERCVEMFRAWVERLILDGWIDVGPLRGKNLACWCPLDQPCHADVLLQLANSRDEAHHGGSPEAIQPGND